MDGVLATRVGYAGGAAPRASYHDIGDHSEAVEILYDPALVTYQDLLDAFWDGHDPGGPAPLRQYASLILFHDAEQERLARASLARQEARHGTRYTEILRAARFHQAEDYHQKFHLRQYHALRTEFRALYPDFDRYVLSTAAARVNGLLGGFGAPDFLDRQGSRLGLSARALALLATVLDNRFHGANRPAMMLP